ncbi:putative carboxylesterase [Phaeosphaeria sp. MPI-PUGE-AT-0046c]|nr:putative carboxylesterase [Phaeosphaeria sp. MPI-PUGE-AT-0046c]
MAAVLHTTLGSFAGKKGEGVTQYLGIKYASVKDQLAGPEIVQMYGGGVVDASRYGPRAPAMDGCTFEQTTLIQCEIGPAQDEPDMSGTECLNLNITVPDIENAERLPVMVWIHGGGFIMGANYWAQYDPSRLVKMSVELGMPVVVVGINYRLGVLGNLASQELRDAGYLGNNSLRDQKCALQWVKANIGMFGGDPENVTAFGESAGAASVLYQLHSKEPLFKRCISMSGTPIMLKPLPLPVAEMAYTSILEAFGLENASAEERINKLKAVTPEKLVEKTPMSVPLSPISDGDILPRLSVPHLPSQGCGVVSGITTFANLGAMDHESLPGMSWCKELMIGDCQHDGNVFLFMSLAQRKAGIANALSASLRANLPASACDAVLQAYGIEPASDDDKAMKLIIDLGTDIAYAAPALAYARSFPGKTFYYQFNEPNPWDGVFKGNSTHMLDAAFLFQNFNNHMPSEAQEVAKGLAVDFVHFVHGKSPWVEYNQDQGRVRAYGPSDKKSTVEVVDKNGWGSGRRDILWRLSEEGMVDLDQLSVAWDMFIAGR